MSAPDSVSYVRGSEPSIRFIRDLVQRYRPTLDEYEEYRRQPKEVQHPGFWKWLGDKRREGQDQPAPSPHPQPAALEGDC